MAESTARVEKFEKAHASESLFYLWEVAHKPLAIRVGLDFVDKLDREVVASFRSVTERGSEIGGILLGRIVPGAPPVVVIEDYERVACDYSRGPLYRLGTGDKDRFDAILRQRAGDSTQGLAVVGMFRSNTRKGLSLDPEDAAFFAERFHDPQQVVLLVRPFATKPSVAAFFFRENGAVQAESSYLEFPFARAELAQQSVTVGDAPAASATPAPPAPKTPARAQVVPIASRRDTSAAVRQVAPEAPPPPAAPDPPAAAQQRKPAAAQEPETAAAVSTPPAAPPDPPAAAQQREPASAQQREPASAQQPEPAGAVSAPPEVAPEPGTVPEAAIPIPPPRFLGEPESGLQAPFMSAAHQASRRGKWIWIAGGGVAALLLVGLLFFYPGFLIPHGRSPVPAPAESNSLELRVERTAGQLLLTWNRETELIKTATKAVLSISDGQQRENVELDLAQLRNGSVIYSPVTSDVNFRLDVTSSKPELSRSELVRVLGTRPSAMPAPGSEEARKGSNAAQPESAASAPEAVTEEPSEPVAEAAPAPPRKNLSLAGRLRPANPAELPEPPSFAGGVHTAPGLPMATVGVPAPPPVAAPAAPPSARTTPTATAPPTQEAIKVGGNVQEAKLIRRVDPVYPPIARQARVRGVVEVQATIGKDGHVREVRVLGGHPLLQQAAAEAVKKWVYTPTLLNGGPVEVVTRVNVGFNLGN